MTLFWPSKPSQQSSATLAIRMFPTVHVYLAYVWCMVLNHASIRLIKVVVPWRKLTALLNTMICSETDLRPVESDYFPEEKKHMPQDFLVQGQLWSHQYYPSRYFDKAVTEDDGRSIEHPSLSIARTYQCLWLGARLTKICSAWHHKPTRMLSRHLWLSSL